METIKHKSQNHKINPDTEVLIIGTFNPDSPLNPADFFYGRNKNFLWTLLPVAFGEDSLKSKSLQEKQAFIQRRKIDFIDLISEIVVDEPSNYNDDYLDNKPIVWKDVISEIEMLPYIQKICFTRKGFSGIPNMKSKIEEIQKYCEKRGIYFKCLITPSRFYREDKQQEWSDFFSNKVQIIKNNF